ncbi:uncharacterized protein IWZ02DRAFT_451173 [Phyllosticta citriasiana]|uniref:uncharacterized protein n=1 Tax=Phyllosticta citriasiana TaxID=595635 RepID=UPI0030FDE54A
MVGRWRCCMFCGALRLVAVVDALIVRTSGSREDCLLAFFSLSIFYSSSSLPLLLLSHRQHVQQPPVGTPKAET